MKEKFEVIYLGRYNLSEILNGPEKVAKRIFNEHSKSGKTVFMEYFFDGRKYNLFKKLFGYEIVDSVNGSYVIRIGLIKLFFTLFKLKPDVIHVICFERFCVVAFLYKFFSGTKILYNIHGVIRYENECLRKTGRFLKIKDKIAEKIYLKFSDVLLVLSLKGIDILKKYYEIDDFKIVMVENGIDEIFYLKGLNKDIFKKDSIDIVFIGNIKRKEKGFEILNDSVKNLKCKTNIHIISEIKNIKSYNPDVQFYYYDLMNSEYLSEFFLDKDIIISPAFYENFGISVIEAMAVGLIPVVSSETGMSKFVENNYNGFIFDYRDKSEPVRIIENLFADVNLRKKISENAKRIYSNLFWENIYMKYTEIYSKLYK